MNEHLADAEYHQAVVRIPLSLLRKRPLLSSMAADAMSWAHCYSFWIPACVRTSRKMVISLVTRAQAASAPFGLT